MNGSGISKLKIPVGAYGYEKNETVAYNGSLITVPESILHMNYLEAFELSFNKLRFETLLYPYFDGSTEIIIPIRGVDHELALTDKQTEQEINGRKGTWSSTIPPGYDPDKWAIVFATGGYSSLSGMNDIDHALWGGYLFIMGEASPGYTHWPNGIYDYGWRVMFCMDDHFDTPTKTCQQTEDEFLEEMF